MTFTFSLAWWWIPAALTLAGLIWALFIVDPGDGMFSCLNNAFALVPVSVVSAIAWAVAAIFK